MTARPAAAGACVALVLVVLAYSSVTSVPPGSIGIVLGGHGTLGPGWHIHVPLRPPAILPADQRRYSGVVSLTTPEGATLEYPYRLSLDLGRAAAGPLSRLAARVGEGRPVGHAVTEEVASAVAAVSGSADPSRMQGAAVERLAGLGLVEGSLRIGPPRGADENNPLRSAYGGPDHRLLVIGIDSADWDLMGPLMESGELPNLKALRDRGAWSTLKSMVPTLSPLLWTTVATGKRPEDHGVIDFLMVDPVTGLEAPISRFFRRVKALWNISSDMGISSLTVGWWASWPAERVLGSIITDRVAYTLFDIPLGDSSVGVTYPDDLIEEVADLVIDESAVAYEDLRGIVNVSEAEFEGARRILGPEGYRDPLAHLIKVMASTESYHRIARHLIRRDRPDLALVYFEGLDEVNHRFAHYLPPAMSLVEETDPSLIEAYGRVVPGFYRYQDRLVGELMEASGPGTVVMILSDHGFANGSERPLDMAPNIEGKPGLWHTLDGVFIVAGPPVRPGPIEGEIGLLDVAPTILSILGLPPAKDLPGRVVSEIFDGAPPVAPDVAVASYDAIGEPIQNVAETIASGSDPEMIAKLRALGYIQAGGAEAAGATTPTYHINSGRLFLEAKDLDRAELEFNRARELAPNYDQALLGLAEVRILRGEPKEAIPLMEKVLREKKDPQPSLLTRCAMVYSRAGMERQGIETLGSLSYTGRREAFRLAALGTLRERVGDKDGALSAYRESVGIDRGVVRAVEGIYRLMTERGDLEGLGTVLEGSLEAESRGARVRVANWLALTRERQGRDDEARAILAESLRESPEEVITLTNLGSMLVRKDDAEEGLPLLERAREQRPGSIEIVVSLIVAHGKLSNLAEARRLLEGGESLAREDEMKHLYNAIGYACYLNGAIEDAAGFIDRSLALDPEQENARTLREEIAKAGR